MKYVYLTVINDTKYLKGLKVLCASLKATNPIYPICVLVSEDIKESVKDATVDIDIISTPPFNIDIKEAESNTQEYWNNTFFKLQIMNLTQFDKIVYIDSDMLVLNNLDNLFDYPGLSATTGGKSAHPEYTEFNSGIMVIEPSNEEYKKLIKCIKPAIDRKKKQSKGYGDQDVFNEYYKDWNEQIDHDFGEEYNATYGYLDALMLAKRYNNLQQLKVIHYVGPDKIWNNSVCKNMRLIFRYIHEGRIYTAKAWWLYMKWIRRIKN